MQSNSISPAESYFHRQGKGPGHLLDQFRRSQSLPLILLALLNLAFFADALFTTNTFFVRDVSFFHYPLKRLVTEAFSQGEWPLWNPYLQLGQPLLANPNAMAFYPTQMLFHWLPFKTAYELHFVLHCFLAGIATFFLGQRLGLSRGAAFLSAVVYNFSGVTLSFVNLFTIIPAVAFLPLLTWLLIDTLQKYSLARVAVCSLLFGCFFLMLEPVVSLGVALFLVPTVVTVYFRAGGSGVSWRRAVVILLVVGLTSLLLAAIQILPTWELTQYSGRKLGLDLEIATFWSMHPMNLLQLVSPAVFGNPYKLVDSYRWGGVFFDHKEPFLISCYLGGVPLLLALWAGLFSKPRWRIGLIAAVGFVSLLLAFGKHSSAYSWLSEAFPWFSYGRFPVKFFFVTNLCLALLAGFGMDGLAGWWRDRVKDRHAVRGSFVLIVLLLLVLLGSMFFYWNGFWDWTGLATMTEDYLIFHYAGDEQQVHASIVQTSLHKLQVSITAFLILAVLVACRRDYLAWIRIGTVGFVLYDLFLANYWINPVISVDLYEDPPAAVAFLRPQIEKKGPFRIFSLHEQTEAGPPVLLGTSDSIAWSALFRKEVLAEFLAAKDHIQFAVFQPIDRLETGPSQMIFHELKTLRNLEEKIRLLAGLNVFYLLSMEELDTPLLTLEALISVNSPAPLRIYRLVETIPRAFVVQWAGAEDQEADFNFASVLSLDANRGEVAPSLSAGLTDPFHWSAKILNYQSNRVEIEVSSNRPALLILLDSYYPGWRAMIDTRQAEIRNVNHVFRGLAVPAGHHQVRFWYEPPLFFAGLWISLVTLSAWGLVLMARYGSGLLKRRRR